MAEYAAIGITAEDLDVEEPIELWPDTAAAFALFCDLGTQWRVGPAGPTGLDYCGVQAVLNMQRVPRRAWPELFDDLRELEAGALAAINKK